MDIERDRQTDEKDRQTDETDRQTNRQTDIQTVQKKCVPNCGDSEQKCTIYIYFPSCSLLVMRNTCKVTLKLVLRVGVYEVHVHQFFVETFGASKNVRPMGR